MQGTTIKIINICILVMYYL